MKKNTAEIDHLNFSVSNFDQSANWYKKVFGFEVVQEGVDTDGHKWGILRSVDSMLAIYEDPKKKGVYRGEDFHHLAHFGLKLQDRSEWEETLKTRQLETFFMSPITYPHSHSWYVKDPTGNTIEVAIWNDNRVQFSV